MRTIFFLCLLTCLFSCQSESEQKEPFKSMLAGCEKVNIVFVNKTDSLNRTDSASRLDSMNMSEVPDSLNFQTTDSSGIQILTQMIKGDNETVEKNCPVTGVLHYIKQNQEVLNAQFSLSDSALKTNCDYIMYTANNITYTHKLNNRGGRFLDELYAQIKIQKKK